MLHRFSATLQSLPDEILAAVCGLFGLVLYIRTLAPSVLASDLSEFQFVLHNLDLPHPTGYPLYVMVGHLWGQLPIGSVAYRINLLSAVFGAVTLSLVYLILRRIVRFRGIAMALTVGFAVTPTYWSQMIVAGSYPLNAFIFALLLYNAFRVIQGDGQLEWVAIAYGLGLAHHRTIILTTPALIYLWARQSKYHSVRQVIKLLAFACLIPAIIYLYIPIRIAQLNRTDLAAPSQLIDYVSGRAFSYLLFQGGWSGLLQQAANWWAWLIRELTWVGVALAGTGLIITFRNRRQLAIFTSLIYICYVAYNLNYYIGNIWIYYLPTYLVALVWIGVFFDQVMSRLENWWSSRKQWRRLSYGFVILGLISAIGLRTILSFPTIDQSHNYTLENLWLDALSLPLKTNAAVLVNWNKLTPLIYYMSVEKRHPDLEPSLATDNNLQHSLSQNQTVYAADLPPTIKPYILESTGPLLEIRAQPYRLSDLNITRPLNATFDGLVRLNGYDFIYARRDADGNDRYWVALYWSVNEPMTSTFGISVRLYQQDQLIAQTDDLPLKGRYPPNRWQMNEVVIDQKLFVVSAKQFNVAAPVTIKVVVYEPDTLRPLTIDSTGDTELNLGLVPIAQ